MPSPLANPDPPTEVSSKSTSTIPPSKQAFTFIISHLDPELGSWSQLEYRTIASECRERGCKVVLAGVEGKAIGLEGVDGVRVEKKGVEELFPLGSRVCLLDPQAERDLSPSDGDVFEGFLFGGILGEWGWSSCLLHLSPPSAAAFPLGCESKERVAESDLPAG